MRHFIILKFSCDAALGTILLHLLLDCLQLLCHPHLALRSPQPLSYCRALCSNKSVIDDFFAKLGGSTGD